MTPRLTLTVAPASEPVTLAEAKAHLRVTHSDEDTLIAGLVVAARAMVESDTQRALITQTWRVDYEALCSELYIPRPPVAAVTGITYLDDGNTRQALDSSLYRAVNLRNDPVIIPAYNTHYPAALIAPESVQVTITAGYGTAPADVPQLLKQAMLLLIGHLYENREIAAPVQLHEVPRAYKALIAPFGYWRF